MEGQNSTPENQEIKQSLDNSKDSMENLLEENKDVLDSLALDNSNNEEPEEVELTPEPFGYNTALQTKEGGVYGVTDKNKDPQSNLTVFGGSGQKFDGNKAPKQPEQTKRSNMSNVWAVKRDEKPTELREKLGISQYPEADELRKAAQEQIRSMKKLDDADQLGRRQGNRAVYKMVERKRVLEDVSNYEKNLMEGKILTEEEKDYVFNKRISKNLRYQEFKKSYETKNLSDEDMKILLETRFKDEMNQILEDLKGEDGNFSSKKLNMEEMQELRTIHKDKLYSEYFQNNKASAEESDKRFRDKNVEEWRAKNPNWSVKNELRDQEFEIMKKENDLLKQALQQQNTSEFEGIDDNDLEPEDLLEAEPTPKVKKEINTKRLAFIAGIVAGGTTGILAGASIALPAAGAAAVAGLATLGAEKLSQWGIGKLEQQLSNAPTEEQKEKLEKRINILKKISVVALHANRFFAGAGIGLAVSGFVSRAFMGGEGLIDKLGATTNAPDTTAAADTFQKASDKTLPNGPENNPNDLGNRFFKEGIPKEPLQTDGVLVQDGHVNLEGSAWNGNLGGNTQPGLNPLNPSHYTGGIHEMAPRMLENDLIQLGVTRDMLMNNLGTQGTHSLLNNYLYAIQNGTTDPNLLEILNKMGSEGAKNLANAIAN